MNISHPIYLGQGQGICVGEMQELMHTSASSRQLNTAPAIAEGCGGHFWGQGVLKTSVVLCTLLGSSSGFSLVAERSFTSNPTDVSETFLQ